MLLEAKVVPISQKIRLPLYGSQLAFGAKKIDLICLDESTLVYIEVQLRPQGVCISGIRSINTNKKAILLCTAQAYLYRLKRKPEIYRFDVVSIAFSGSNQHEISDYRNVALF